MNKINPLFEAISNIDDNIAANAIKENRRHPKKIKVILIAAAAAAMCAITTVTAVARLKSNLNVTIDSISVEPYYNTTSAFGKEWDIYVIDLPDYVLGEEEKEKTAVGKIDVVPNPEYPEKFGKWMIVDETGNKFYTGINNKLILVRPQDGDASGFDEFCCTNFLSDDYGYFETYTGNSLKFDLVPLEKYEEFKEQWLQNYTQEIGRS